MLKTADILKKTEKIASAAYLLTSFFDDKEPLKWDIRNLSSKLVSKAAHMKDVSADARELLALFSVARAAGLVSDANFEILSGEAGKLVDLGEQMPAQLIGSGFFDAPLPAETPHPQAPVIKDKYPEPALLEPVPERPKEAPRQVLREFGAVAVKKNSRQSIIIGLLKKKKEIMIKDVSPLIEGVSEKTIQRELLAMVDQGIIKKEGEKRWSRYLLA